jgi:hypothetical protein
VGSVCACVRACVLNPQGCWHKAQLAHIIGWEGGIAYQYWVPWPSGLEGGLPSARRPAGRAAASLLISRPPTPLLPFYLP